LRDGAGRRGCKMRAVRATVVGTHPCVHPNNMSRSPNKHNAVDMPDCVDAVETL